MSAAVVAVNAVITHNAVDISADGNKIKLDGTAKMLASSGFGTVDETFKGGPRNWKMTYSGFYNGGSGANEQTLVADFNNNTQRQVIVYPEGNVSTKRKYLFNALIDKFTPFDLAWDQLAKLDFSYQISGAVTPSTVP